MVISIIVSCKNEKENIGNTLDILSKVKNSEVIVVDNSDDGSKEIIKEYNCLLIDGMGKGKGDAMRIGYENSEGDILVYMDADIETLEAQWIYDLVIPIYERNFDIVKASYDYEGEDLVTKLIAKPLLSHFFPDVCLTRPIEGEMALKRGVLDNINLESNFGVESSFIIDAYQKGYSITQVKLGTKLHPERHGIELLDLSKQVFNSIMDKALEYKRI